MSCNVLYTLKSPAQAKRDVPPGSVLAIAVQGLGDLLMFLPAARVIRQALPEATLDLVTLRGPNLEIARSSSYFDHIYLKNMRELLVLRRRQYDYCLVAYPSLIRPHLFARFVNARQVVGHPYDLGLLGKRSFFCDIVINNSTSDHLLDRNLELAKALGIDVTEADHRPFLRLPAEADGYADRFVEEMALRDQSPIVGIHPGSGAGLKAKRWPRERFAALARQLCNRLGARVIVFTGPDEADVGEVILEELPESVKAHAGETFLHTAAVVGRCHLFISNDTALMHTATALDVPTIALFGPTDPGHNSPYGPAHVVIRKQLPCSPCYKLTHYNVRCPIRYECMHLITVEEVLAQAEKMLLEGGQ